MPSTYKAPEYPYVTPPELAAGGIARTQVAIVGAGPIGLAAGDRPGAARHRVHPHRRQQHGQRRFARDLLRQARARDPRSARLRRRDLRARHRVEGRQGLLPRRARVPVRPAARTRPQAPGLREPAAVPPRGMHGGAARGARPRRALEEQGGRRRRARRRRACRHRDAGRPLCDRGGVRDRGRRRAQRAARPDGARVERAGLPRPFPDRRRAHEGRVSHRALVLVRSAVPSGAVGAAAPAGRRRLAHRLPARLGRRPGGREEAGACDPAHPRNARRRPAVRAGVGQRLHVPVPAPRPLRPRSRAVCRRRGASGIAVRRARRQLRLPGRRQPLLEACARVARRVAGRAA